MKQMLNKKLNGWQIICVSVLSAIAVLLFVIIKLGGCYETNNDRIINEIFSGAMTGTPDPHAICVNYILGVIFASLYNTTKSVPWYGLFLLCCYFFINTFVLSVILKKGRNPKEQLCLWFLSIFVILTNLYIFSVLQFTTIAGALAVAGYVWLLLDKCPWRRYIIFGLFELLAVLLRRDSMLMIQPIGMSIIAAYLLLLLIDDISKVKEYVVELGKSILVVVVVFSVYLAGNYVIGDYSSPEWREYTEYNDLCVKLVDYYGYPEFEECKEILERYGVSKLDYHAIGRYYILDNALENECMEELSTMSQKQYYDEHPFSLIGIIKRMINYFRYDKCFGYEIAVPVMYVFVCGMFILSKKWKEILPVIALFGSRYVIFAYLIIKGRITHGVINILFFAELFFLLAIFAKGYLDGKTDNSKNMKVRYLITAVFVGMMTLAIIRSYAEAEKSNTNAKDYENAIMKIFNYIDEKGSGFIICDEVTTYYMGTALDTTGDIRVKILWLPVDGFIIHR